MLDWDFLDELDWKYQQKNPHIHFSSYLIKIGYFDYEKDFKMKLVKNPKKVKINYSNNNLIEEKIKIKNFPTISIINKYYKNEEVIRKIAIINNKEIRLCQYCYGYQWLDHIVATKKRLKKLYLGGDRDSLIIEHQYRCPRCGIVDHGKWEVYESIIKQTTLDQF